MPLHPAQPAWAGRFPESSRLPSTVWVFVLNLALNASPVLSQFTRVYSGSSVVLLTVPLGKCLLSSLSERTGQARIKGVRTSLVTPGGHGLPGGGAGRTHLAGGPAENGGGAGSRMDLPVGERRCPRTPDLGDDSLGWD